MDKKKEIGLKIWELFLKNYSYREIAKELGVSKSVVSNIINYCLPPNENSIQEDIKKLKQEQEQELIKCKKNYEKEINNYKEKIHKLKNKNDKLKEEIQELEEEIEELEEELENNELETKITSILVTFFVTFIIFKLSYDFLFNQNFLIKLVTLFIIFILATTISFFATTLIKRFGL